jgi:hypothetical protein
VERSIRLAFVARCRDDRVVRPADGLQAIKVRGTAWARDRVDDETLPRVGCDHRRFSVSGSSTDDGGRQGVAAATGSYVDRRHELGEAAAEAMGARFLPPSPRDGRAMASGSDGESG